MLRHALTIALAAALTATGAAAPAAGATSTDRAASSASAQSDLIGLINTYRANKGLQQISPNGALTAAAAWMAADMAAKNYLAHVSSDGRSPAQRMSAFGYPASSMYTGENLGAGYGTAGAVFAGWQASAAHDAILSNPNYNAVGVGVAYNANSTYRWYWVVDFGGPGGIARIIPPPPQPAARSQPVVERAAPAPRGSETGDETLDPEALAQAARAAVIERIDARRIAHLLAVLERMGEI